jgi:hypothetical protein
LLQQEQTHGENRSRKNPEHINSVYKRYVLNDRRNKEIIDEQRRKITKSKNK